MSSKRRLSGKTLRTAFRSMGAVAGILMLLGDVTRGEDSAAPAREGAQQALTVKVFVLNFDPKIPQHDNRPLHEVCGWTDPKKLAEGYLADVKAASGGFIDYRLVTWRDVDDFHTKADGFKYTVAEYMKCRAANQGWHEPDRADYPKTFTDFGLLPLIDKGEIDEVWFFGGPYFGYCESAMAGPRAFYINGDVYAKVPSKRPFAVMGFNYERGVAEMLHDLSHRTESTMARAYGGWKSEELTTNWARFAANAKQSNGIAAAGSCHYPPNGRQDYDYANAMFVDSSADDWLNYPKLTGKKTRINCETWGGPDYHRNYMKWWFDRLPRATGVHEDGRLNNWWRYVFDFDRYDDRGRLKQLKTSPR